MSQLQSDEVSIPGRYEYISNKTNSQIIRPIICHKRHNQQIAASGDSNDNISIDCPSNVLELFANTFHHPYFGKKHIEFRHYIDGTIKLQRNDGYVVIFSTANGDKLGVFNSDLRSKKSGKKMYGILNITSDHGQTVWRLRRFLSAEMVREIAKKCKIKLFHLPKSSRETVEFKQQLAQPIADDIKEGIDSKYTFDNLPCVAIVAFNSNHHYIVWTQIVYDEASDQYHGVGFRYINKTSFVYGLYSHNKIDIDLTLLVPNDVLDVIVLYCSDLMVCDRDINIDDIGTGNILLGDIPGMMISERELNKYRTLNDDDLCLNMDGSYAYADPPYL